jgi:hypothetical protein
VFGENAGSRSKAQNNRCNAIGRNMPNQNDVRCPFCGRMVDIDYDEHLENSRACLTELRWEVRAFPEKYAGLSQKTLDKLSDSLSH